MTGIIMNDTKTAACLVEVSRLIIEILIDNRKFDLIDYFAHMEFFAFVKPVRLLMNRSVYSHYFF